jgi:ABC-2 type transport system ATP-binding protein
MYSLEVDRVNKYYNSFHAVKDISFSIEEGHLFGLLGPNGAGKTTTMRMIMNIIIPDSGSIRLFGENFIERHKDQIGYLPEERGLYPKMKLIDHLQFLGELKGLSSSNAHELSIQWLDRFELNQWQGKKIQELSKGMQQKVQFIGTIIHSPNLLILDEPFSGLDPINTKFMKDILLHLKEEGNTIILSTHLIDQAEKLCDDICLINRGEVILSGNLKEKKSEFGHNSIVLKIDRRDSFIKNLAIIENVENYGNYMEVQLKEDIQPATLLNLLVESNVNVQKFEVTETSLNQIFIDLIGNDSNGQNNINH